MKTVAVIPAYNEEENIEKVIEKVKRVKSINKIIVIDDGSEDNTAKIARKMKVIVLRHKKNKGKGEALRTGFNYVLKKLKNIKYVVVIDADLQFEPKESEKFLKILKNGKAELVIGKRNFRKMPFRHLIGNILWKNTFNILFGTKFEDTNCGYFALLKDV